MECSSRAAFLSESLCMWKGRYGAPFCAQSLPFLSPVSPFMAQHFGLILASYFFSILLKVSRTILTPGLLAAGLILASCLNTLNQGIPQTFFFLENGAHDKRGT